MRKLFVGLDISQLDYKVSIIDQEGDNPIAPFAVDNNEPGSNKLVDKLLAVCKKTNTQTIFIGFESTSVYGWHIQYFLADNKELKPYNPSIICFNPKIIDKFKKSLNVNPYKDDWVDANAIAERLRFGRLPKASQVDFRYLSLQRLTRHRFHLIRSLIKEKCYYLNNLFLKFNGLCQTKVFSNNFGATASSLFDNFFNTEEIAKASMDELIDFLIDKGKGKFDEPEKVAKKLKQAAANSYKLRPNIDDSLNFVLCSCRHNITSLNQQIRSVDKVIEREVMGLTNEYQCLKSIKGIGPVIAAGIIAEISNISRFDSESALAKYSGIYWNKYQSGSYEAEDSSVQRTGNSYLRYYFVQAAEQMRRHLPEFNEFYTRKYNESKTHKHKRALILTARKAVRLIFALLREEKLYKPSAKKGEVNINNK